MANEILTPTIFHEDWWLNAATNGHYQVAEVSSAGRVVGRLPYYPSRRLGMKWISMPPLTHFCGPAVDEGDGNIHTRFSSRLEITRELIQKLPRASYVQIRCHKGIRDVIPFQEQTFKTSIQFTSEIHPAPEDVLWKNMRNERRRIMTKPLANSTISSMDDPVAFMRFYQANLDAKGIRNEMDTAACCRIIEACLTRQRGRILALKDKDGTLQAAIFCPWDDAVKYYLMTTRAPTSTSGDVSALVWREIQDSSSRQLIFDFDGIATEGSIMFFAGFGGTIEPRFVAMKMSLPVHFAHVIYSAPETRRLFKNPIWR